MSTAGKLTSAHPGTQMQVLPRYIARAAGGMQYLKRLAPIPLPIVTDKVENTVN
jgi:hypothetical protein